MVVIVDVSLVLVGRVGDGLCGVPVLFVLPVVVEVGIALSVTVLVVVGFVDVVELLDVISPVGVDVVVSIEVVVDVVGTSVVVVDISGVVVLLGRVHIKYFWAATPSYILQPNPHDATETGLSPDGLFVQIQGGNCCSASPVGSGISICEL